MPVQPMKTESAPPGYRKKVVWGFVVLTVVMIVQFAIHLKGTEPYPAIIHPSFGRTPGKDGKGTWGKPEVHVHLANGEIVEVNFMKVFNRLRPWFVNHTMRMLERKASQASGETRSLSIGPYTYELRRFLTRDDEAYAEFKQWTLQRITTLLGDVEVVSVVFAQTTYSYDLDATPVTLTRLGTHVFDTVNY